MKNKFERYLGRFLYLSFAQWLPVSHFPVNLGQTAIRRFCARRMLEKCGKDVNIERKAHFSSRLQIGDRSGIGAGSWLSGTVCIGNDVMMGPTCTIYTRNHEFSDPAVPMNQQGFQEEKPVVIEDDIWIGAHVLILPGVHIGSHSVIGAGAVVTKDVPDWAVVGGNPATVRHYRTHP